MSRQDHDVPYPAAILGRIAARVTVHLDVTPPGWELHWTAQQDSWGVAVLAAASFPELVQSVNVGTQGVVVGINPPHDVGMAQLEKIAERIRDAIEAALVQHDHDTAERA